MAFGVKLFVLHCTYFHDDPDEVSKWEIVTAECKLQSARPFATSVSNGGLPSNS